MSKRLKISLIILAVFIVGAGLFFYFYSPEVNYLIPGVPYYGFYNHYFDTSSSVATIPASILDYWGDARFSLADLKKNLTTDKYSDYKFSNIRKFFEDNGYATSYWTSTSTKDVIPRLKGFINPEKKIPVIVLQKKYLDPGSLNGYRLVIGISDKDKKVIVHDYDFGNNYEISYDNFEAMFNSNGRAFLAAWPSEDLMSKLKRPDYVKPYPERLPIMDSNGKMLAEVSTAVFDYNFTQNFEEALRIYQKFVNDPNFNNFPPAHRVSFYSSLAAIYIALNNLDKAIEIITSQAMPLNNNLNQPYNGLTEQVDFFKANNYTENKLETPFYMLGRAYLLKGDKKSAQKNFEEALKINPSNLKVQDAFRILNLK